MNKYKIIIHRDDIPSNNVQENTKWATDERQALSYIFKNKLKRDKYGTLKRGGWAKLISIQRIK